MFLFVKLWGCEASKVTFDDANVSSKVNRKPSNFTKQIQRFLCFSRFSGAEASGVMAQTPGVPGMKPFQGEYLSESPKISVNHCNSIDAMSSM